MSNIVSICAINKNEAKIQNMKSAFEAITTATKDYSRVLRLAYQISSSYLGATNIIHFVRECVIEPNTRIDHLYKKIENTMARW